MSWADDHLDDIAEMADHDGPEEPMNEYVQVTIDRVVHYTDKAVLVEITGEQMWLPRGQLEETYTDEAWEALKCGEGLPLEIGLAKWLAEQKGL